jgi:hypothetical protein
MTPFLALSQLVAAGDAGVVSDPDLLVEAATWSKSQHATVVQAARELSEITEAAGPYFQHPYFGVHATSVQPAELVRMIPSLTTLAMAASELASNVEAIANYIGIEHEASLSLCSSLVAILEIIALSLGRPQDGPLGHFR